MLLVLRGDANRTAGVHGRSMGTYCRRRRAWADNTRGAIADRSGRMDAQRRSGADRQPHTHPRRSDQQSWTRRPDWGAVWPPALARAVPVPYPGTVSERPLRRTADLLLSIAARLRWAWARRHYRDCRHDGRHPNHAAYPRGVDACA